MSFEIKYDNHQDEETEERCGEIFMTMGRNMVFLCTLCDMKYNNFGEYVAHLDEHFPAPDSVIIEEIEIDRDHSCDTEISLKGDFLKEASETANPSKSIKEDSSENECSEFEAEDFDIKDTESIIKTEETVHIDMNVADSEYRPVQKKTMYLQPQGEIRKFECTLCNARFKDNNGLKKHIERHMTQKSHQCPQCPKKFYSNIDVRVHLRVHTGERPFLCTICGKTFLTNVKLTDHMRRHTNQRDYKCPYCEKSFYNSNLLTGHLQVHSKERRHTCPLCKGSFAYRKGLRNHMKLHENKRNYKCELCEASFNQQAGLFCHMKNKHKEDA